MEYAMCTLITGERTFSSLVGVTAHEFAHSWFQFVLATNETKHSWMDEGFTSYISSHCMNSVMDQGKSIPNKHAYTDYAKLVRSGLQEPLTTFSDRYELNGVYGTSAYNKGSIFLSQLGYVIGRDNLNRTIKTYYEQFKFKHPTPNDFIRVAEKVSGIQLEWYLNYWTRTIKYIDYSVSLADKNSIKLERLGSMAMPIDLTVTYTDGSTEDFYLPLTMMYGTKPTDAKILESWSWVAPSYTLNTEKEIERVQVDPSQLLADIDPGNNTASIK